jgi:arginine-tRNA-protein transferase
VVHEAEYGNLIRSLEPEHKFEVTLEPDIFTEEKFKLFEDYQRHVHHEPPSKISPSGFKSFLCGSPLTPQTSLAIGASTKRLGSYHQCYRLDGRLIAMGVLDLLPHCVSGVYLIYHSDFEKWGFGKISALHEASLALEGGYQYYYMGYYIHSCVKMRYKNNYKPQYLLDLETFDWNLLDGETQKLLDEHPYLSLSRERKTLAAVEKEGSEISSPGEQSVNDTLNRVAFSSAAEAERALDNGISLFDLDFPGMMTLQELEEEVDLDRVKIQISGGTILETRVSEAKSSVLSHFPTLSLLIMPVPERMERMGSD